jgi:hypothetical protein
MSSRDSKEYKQFKAINNIMIDAVKERLASLHKVNIQQVINLARKAKRDCENPTLKFTIEWETGSSQGSQIHKIEI